MAGQDSKLFWGKETGPSGIYSPCFIQSTCRSITDCFEGMGFMSVWHDLELPEPHNKIKLEWNSRLVTALGFLDSDPHGQFVSVVNARKKKHEVGKKFVKSGSLKQVTSVANRQTPEFEATHFKQCNQKIVRA